MIEHQPGAASRPLRGRAPLARAAALAVLLIGLLLGFAAPASASHDDYGPGTVILQDRAALTDRVEVVFPLDSDRDEIRQRVLTHARRQGVQVTDLRVEENSGPDTLRVLVTTDLGERTGFLTRRIPRDRIAAWQGLGSRDKLFLSVTSRAKLADAEFDRARNEHGDLAVAEVRDVTYRMSPWVLITPLLVLLAAAVVPYLVLRLFAERVVRRGGDTNEQLHRIRRSSLLVQVAAPAALVGALLATRSFDWFPLLLAETAPGLSLPSWAQRLLAVISSFAPFLLVLAASTAALIPYDRQLRGTQQSTRAGTGQAVRAIALILVPVMLWQVLLVFLPPLDGWVVLPVVAVFALAMAVVGPLLTNSVLTTAPLPPQLRERVLRACAEQGLRVRDVRMIDTRGGKVANAAISGILPQLRSVFLTDRLVEILDDDELDAVLAHEIAHGKGHHLLLKLVGALAPLGALMLLFGIAGEPLLRALPEGRAGLLALPLIPVLMVGVVLLAQGVLGVALEKRADDHAARTAGARPLAAALEKLAEANKMKRRTGWLWNVLQQHPGLEQRLARLHAEAEPSAGSARVTS